jgi:hypothetical protein
MIGRVMNLDLSLVDSMRKTPPRAGLGAILAEGTGPDEQLVRVDLHQ